MPAKRQKKEEKPLWGTADAAIERALAKVRRGDRIITLFSSGPAQVAGDDGAIKLAEALLERRKDPLNEGLVTLKVQGNGVGEEGSRNLAKALEGIELKRLRTLDLSGNKIAEQGGSELGKAFHSGSCLQCLNLSGNSLGDRAAEALAQAMPKHPDLLEVHLEGNKIGEAGAKALAASVARHRRLESFDISGNPLGDGAGQHFANALGQGCGLVTLRVSSANLGNGSCSAIAARLNLQPNLRELWLNGNTIEDAGATDLANAVEEHAQLRLLSLGHNKISDKGIMALVGVLVRLCKEDFTVNAVGNPARRFAESTLTNLSVAAKTARDISRRCITLEAVLKFWKDQLGVGMIKADESTTADVVNTIIVPESELHGTCYSEFFHCFHAEYYVVHAWKGLFGDLLRGLATHASGFLLPSLDYFHEQYIRRPDSLTRRYFIDIFCVEQFKKYPEGDPRCETDKFDFVLHELRLRDVKVVVVLDREYEAMARTWCQVEVHHAKQLEMPLIVSFGPIRPMPRRRKGLNLHLTQTSFETDKTLLFEELKLRGLGTEEKFINECMTPFQKQAQTTYTDIYQTMTIEQQEECDWVASQDDAREDMKMYDEKGDPVNLRIAVNAGIESRVEESTMIPRRQRLSQLELERAVDAKDVDLHEDIKEMERCLAQADEEKLVDPPLLSRSRVKLDALLAERRRREAQKALTNATSAANRVVIEWEEEFKKRKQTNKEKGLQEPVIEFLKTKKEMSNQEGVQLERQQKKWASEKAIMKTLRKCVEEGAAAKVDEAPLLKGRKIYSEIRIHAAVKARLMHLAEEQFAQRKAAEQAAREAAKAAALQAAEEKRAEKEAAGVDEDDEEESDGEPIAEDDSFEEEEEDELKEPVDPKDVEDGSVSTLADALRRGYEDSGKDIARDGGKEWLEIFDYEAFQNHMRSELAFYVGLTSQETLRRIIGQMAAAGLDPQVPKEALEAFAGLGTATSETWAQEAKAPRPGVRQYLPGEEQVESGYPADSEEQPEAPADGEEQPEAPADGEEQPMAEEEELAPPAAPVELSQDELQQAEDATAMVKARTRLAYLVMEDAIQARDLELLHEVVPEAVDHNVEEFHVARGYRTIAELELAIALKKQSIQDLHKTLDYARKTQVEEAIVLVAARELAKLEIKKGIADENAQLLARALDEGKAAGMTDKQLYQGKSFYVKLEITRVLTSDVIKELERVIALGLEIGLPADSKDMSAVYYRLAMLELGEATRGRNMELLKARIEKAKELEVDKELVKQGQDRWNILELEAATQDYDGERLREAMWEGKASGAPLGMFPPAKLKLKDLLPGAYTDWMTMEIEEGVAALTDDNAPSAPLRLLLDAAIEADVDEEDLKPAREKLQWLVMGEAVKLAVKEDIQTVLEEAGPYRFEFRDLKGKERVEALRARISHLEYQENLQEAKENLKNAMMSGDPITIRNCVEEAEKCGVEKEMIDAAKKKAAEMS